jgi:hypothetical protein
VHNGARVTALGGLINMMVDATSSVEFGNAGNAAMPHCGNVALGALTVDAGFNATARGYLISSGNPSRRGGGGAPRGR